MDTIYTDLKARIKLMARGEMDYKMLTSLALRHFEGEYVTDLMPDELKLIIADWEKEQMEID